MKWCSRLHESTCHSTHVFSCRREYLFQHRIWQKRRMQRPPSRIYIYIYIYTHIHTYICICIIYIYIYIYIFINLFIACRVMSACDVLSGAAVVQQSARSRVHGSMRYDMIRYDTSKNGWAALYLVEGSPLSNENLLGSGSRFTRALLACGSGAVSTGTLP